MVRGRMLDEGTVVRFTLAIPALRPGMRSQLEESEAAANAVLASLQELGPDELESRCASWTERAEERASNLEEQIQQQSETLAGIRAALGRREAFLSFVRRQAEELVEQRDG